MRRLLRQKGGNKHGVFEFLLERSIFSCSSFFPPFLLYLLESVIQSELGENGGGQGKGGKVEEGEIINFVAVAPPSRVLTQRMRERKS